MKGKNKVYVDSEYSGCPVCGNSGYHRDDCYVEKSLLFHSDCAVLANDRDSFYNCAISSGTETVYTKTPQTDVYSLLFEIQSIAKKV